jgi:hypothetical protein
MVERLCQIAVENGGRSLAEALNDFVGAAVGALSEGYTRTSLTVEVRTGGR